MMYMIMTYRHNADWQVHLSKIRPEFCVETATRCYQGQYLSYGALLGYLG